MVTFNYLMAQALLVLNAKLRKENSAKRIGGLFRDILLFIQNLGLGMILKGEKSDESEIKSQANPTKGDTYKAIDTGLYWCYDGTGWNDIGELIPSNVATKEELAQIESNMIQKKHLGLSYSETIQTYQGGYINKTGEQISYQPSENFAFTAFESVEQGDSFIMSNVYSSGSVAPVALYDSNKNFLQVYVPGEGVKFYPRQINALTEFVRFSFNIYNHPDAYCLKVYAGTDKIGMDYIQDGDSVINNREMALYKPDGSLVDFMRWDNLLLRFYSDQYWNANTGAFAGLSGWACTDKVGVSPGDVINTVGWLNRANRGYILVWDVEGNFLNYIRPAASTPDTLYSLTVETNWRYMAFNLGNSETAPVDEMIGSFKVAVNNVPLQKPIIDLLVPATNILGDSLLKKKINKNVRWVGMSIWWYDGNTLSGTTEIAIGYQTLLKQQFSFLSESKYCYSGHSLGAATENDSYSIMSKASAWTGSVGDIWTLDSITNDFKRNIPIGTIDDYNDATGITTFYGALRAFKDKVETLSGSTAIVICSNALRRNNANYTSVSANTQGHTLIDYEKAIMTIAGLNKWLFVDQFRLSGITDDSLSQTTLDGLHLNNLGYSLAVLPWYTAFDTVYNRLILDN